MKHVIKTMAISTAIGIMAALPALAQDGVSAAKANIEAFSGIPEFIAPGEPFDARACMAGKSIMTIPSSSAIPFVRTIADHKDSLAEMLGFEHSQWENQGNPTQWIQGMEYAGNNGFDLISLLAGADPRFFEPQVKNAQNQDQTSNGKLNQRINTNQQDMSRKTRTLCTNSLTAGWQQEGFTNIA